jgi:exonuclease VII large subunit
MARLFRPPPHTEDNAARGNALVPIAVTPNGRAELVVDERYAQQQQVGWLSELADEAVKTYLAHPKVDQQSARQLSVAWQIRETWKRQVDEQSKLGTERQELERNLDQLRGSLKAIEKNAQAADLRQKLTRKLGDTSSRLDQITKRLVEVELAMKEHEVRFRDAIDDIKILSAPPPND